MLNGNAFRTGNFSRKDIANRTKKIPPEFALDTNEWLTTAHHPFSPDRQDALPLILPYELIPFTN